MLYFSSINPLFSKLSELIRKGTSTEVKYAIRIALRKLRLGVGEKTILEAFAETFTNSLENKGLIEEKYNIDTDIGSLGETLAKNGLNGIKRISVSIGRPVLPMLAQRIDSFENLLKKLPPKIAAEEKYDGERVQVHKKGNKVTAFSRRLEDISEQYPDIIEAVKKGIKANKVVLDGEIVPYKNGKIGSFQQLMQRRRKYDVEKYRKEIPVTVFFFDILYLNGKSLLNRKYEVRREILEKHVKETKNLQCARRLVTEDNKKVKEFFEDCIKRGLEGIILKSTADDSVYQAGKRGWFWIKWKKDYTADMQDRFDLVVIGSYQGKGRRKKFFGALLCAAYNTNNNTYESFTKVGSGYTDDDFKELKDKLNKYSLKQKPNNAIFEKDMKPDIFYEPKLVIEVIGAEITKSPSHSAGKKKNKKGLALRFPRFIRIRPDKSEKDATTIKEIEEL
jgi:DNA ligase-1